ncbi:hypothetical protein E4P41_03885 [Geodermatophilus sp. DF01-2]|nr:hypothetical protein E4P41_03885 [Geodermatophilus sp. DF01_2]
MARAEPAAAAPPVADKGPSPWRKQTSANGWPILNAASQQTIEGANAVSVAIAEGDAAIILCHVVRRFHYDIDALRQGDVLGHSTERLVAQEYESNYLSGTAIAIRPGSYPAGVAGGLFANELVVVRDILAECGGVVRWGGDEAVPKESHFQIDYGPGAREVKDLAATIRGWNETPGAGAGAVNAFEAGRRRAAEAMEKRQKQD